MFGIPLAQAVIGMKAAGGALAAISSVASGAAEAKASNYNARLTEAAADQQRAEDIEQARRDRVAGRRFMGQQRARAAGSGVLLSSGSPLESEIYNAGQIELRALDAERASRLRKQQGYAKAASLRFQGRAARRAGIISGFGSLLSTGADVGGSVYNLRTTGAL